jgi:PAS domain S-box-containing protein
LGTVTSLDAEITTSRLSRRLFLIAGLTSVYFIAGKIGLRFATVNPSATAIWAPAGITVASLLVLGYWVWPAIFLGAFLVNVTTVDSMVTSLAIAAGNTLEGLIGAYLVNRFANGRRVFERVDDALRFLILAALGSTMVSATIGATSLCMGQFAKWSQYGSIWSTWWLGDGTGDLIAAPLVLLWAANYSVSWRSKKTQDAALLLLLLLIVSWAVFGGLPPLRYPLDFLCVPVLLCIAFRSGPRETAVATLLLSIVALAGTLHGYGAFDRGTPSENLLFLQSFVGVTGLMSIAVAIEVQERRRLSEDQARLAAIIDSSDDAIASKTLDGIVTSWNGAAERMFGYTAAEAIGQHITFIIPPERRAEEEDVLARIRRGEKVRHFETLRQAKDGRQLSISLSISPLKDAEGQIIGASKVARDVTEQKRLWRERERLLEITEAESRAKDEFLAMLGHELRNPLAALATAVHVSARAGERPEIAEKAQAIISRQVDQLSRLVDDLLDAARVTTGRIALYERPTNLADCVAECVRTLSFSEHLDSYDLVVETEPVWVHADPDRLTQIITNLMTNAVRYTTAGNIILISAKAEGDSAVLRIKDSGIGIPAELLPHVFDLFRQGERPLDRSEGGLGIGLTIVKRLVELHGGKVEAASEGANRGSCFTVYLPLIAPPALMHIEPALRASKTAGHRRVLVIEDNADTREGIRAILEMEGHEVYEAEDGPAGIEAVSAVRPDVALIDIGLPHLDGFEVARRISSLPVARKTVLIAITGYAQQEYREKAARAGFQEYLVKPVHPDQLSHVLLALSPVASSDL